MGVIQWYDPVTKDTGWLTACAPFEIGYYLSRRTGNFEVTYADPTLPHHHRNKFTRISINPQTFRKITGVSKHSIAGCIGASYSQMIELGIFCKEVSIT